MSEKSAKKKNKKSGKASSEPSVLGNLRSTRPTRLGGDRRATTSRATATATAPKPAKKKAAKPKKAKPAKKVAQRPTPPPPPPPPEDRRPGGPPRGPEIVTTAVQAAGELAQIGATVGTNLIKRAARRIPRP